MVGLQVLHGVKSFRRVEKHYEFPHLIIGAGHIGLKFAMTWLMEGVTNFLVVDRKDKACQGCDARSPCPHSG